MGWEYMEALRSLATPPQLPPPRLTLPELRRTVSHEGDLLRLQCVLQRLRDGENVTIGVIGGSISAGTSVRVRANQSGLFHKQATEWLQSAYPAAKIVHFNAAMPAIPPYYMEQCLRPPHRPRRDVVGRAQVQADGTVPQPARRQGHVRGVDRQECALLEGGGGEEGREGGGEEGVILGEGGGEANGLISTRRGSDSQSIEG